MIKEHIDDNILIATFANGKFNAITFEMLLQIREIVKKVNEDDSIKGMILTGEGKVFSSGFDLPTFLKFKDLDEVVEFFKDAEDIFMEFFMCKKPVVSAMNGATMAGGLILAMASDYRVCKNHPKIQLSMSEIKIGLGLSVVQSGIMRFGLDSNKKFREIMYFGERYSVDQALEIGLVDELAEEDQLIPRAKEIVSTWIDNPGRAFITLKQSLRKPTLDQMKHYLEVEDWREGLSCMFDPQTRATMEVVAKMMA
ncbi:MAG: enoyl-CoA hydratase/isomerase family protein [bacterium]|nr:enoyl-CoA hydratase/isomerase family protein [bacterium]